MAGIIDDKKLTTPVVKTSASPTTASQTAAAAQTTQSKAVASPYTGLAGLSESTQNALGKYSQGYQQSQDVTAAQDYLNSVVSGKPGDYSSNYKQQLDDIYNQVMNRPQFTYDLNSDMLYQQYKSQYQNLGKQAMMDTTAQAAGLTGGYGNSYAATAGNQAYQNYLQQLNSIVPELYDRAYGRYAQEGQDLMNKYNLTSDLENAEYAKYRDTVADWQSERDFANSDYWNKYNADYGNWQDMLNMYNQFAQMENAQYNTNRDLAYNQAMAIIKTGKTPTTELLNTAGISSKDAKNLVKYYKKKISSSGGGGGGGGGRSSGGSGSGSGSGGGSKGDGGKTYAHIANALASPNYYNKDGSPKSSAFTLIEHAYKSGKLSISEADKLYAALGR